MDRITMGFGPISDVTGFSHKGGMTFLEIQELLRRKINELVAAHASLKSHVDTRNGDVISAFDQTLASFTAQFNEVADTLRAPAAEYAELVDRFNAMEEEFQSMLASLSGTTRMTDEEIASALGV